MKNRSTAASGGTGNVRLVTRETSERAAWREAWRLGRMIKRRGPDDIAVPSASRAPVPLSLAILDALPKADRLEGRLRRGGGVVPPARRMGSPAWDDAREREIEARQRARDARMFARRDELVAEHRASGAARDHAQALRLLAEAKALVGALPPGDESAMIEAHARLCAALEVLSTSAKPSSLCGEASSERLRSARSSLSHLASVRAPQPADGRRLAGLWKLLWDVHESWGSYPGSSDPRVYDDLAQRLSDEARARGSSPLHGRHVHLVAAIGEPEGEGSLAVGQIEGRIERHGESPETKWTCEVRSLVVAEDARHLGAGRALLDELANVVRHALHGAPAVLAAEVLDANPAMAFYRKLGFVMPVHSVRLATGAARARAYSPDFVGRVAVPEDALPLAGLDANLAERRRLVGDFRFDGPRALDAALVDAIALRLGNATRRGPTDPAEVVVVDRGNVPRASASLVFATLEPPFLPGVRAMLSRPSFDAATSPYQIFPALVRLAGSLACLAGAEHLEILDLPGLETDMTRAALATGAVPWARVALRDV